MKMSSALLAPYYGIPPVIPLTKGTNPELWFFSNVGVHKQLKKYASKRHPYDNTIMLPKRLSFW